MTNATNQTSTWICSNGPFGPVDDLNSSLTPCFVDVVVVIPLCLAFSVWLAIRLVLMFRHWTHEPDSMAPKGYELLDDAGRDAEFHDGRDTEFDVIRIEQLCAARSPETYAILVKLAVADVVQKEGPRLRMMVVLATMLVLVVRVAETATAEVGEAHNVLRHVVESIAWAIALVVVIVEGRQCQERGSAVLLWFCMDWISSSLCLHTAVVQHAEAEMYSSGGTALVVLSYAASCTTLILACVVSFRQHSSAVEDKRQDAFMLLRRPDSYPKTLRLLMLAVKDKFYIAAGLAGFVVHSMARLMWAVLYGQLINAVYAGDSSEIHHHLMLFIAVILFQGTFDIIGGTCLEVAASRLGTRLQRMTFNVLVEQDMAYFDKSRTGKLMTILESNVGDVQNVLTLDLGDTFEGVITSCVLLTYMWITTWKMALVFTLACIFPLVVISINAFFVEKMNAELKDLEGDQGQVANEQLGSMRTVKSFGAEEHSKELYAQTTRKTYFQQIKIQFFEAVMNGFAMDLGWPSVILACFFVGAPQTIDDFDFRPDFVAFSVIANQAINQLEKTFETVPQFAKAIGASCKIFDVFDHEADINYTGGARLPHVQGEIVFEGVHFSYRSLKEISQPIFDGLSFRVTPGQHVALVGPSGAGKSTAFALLCRFYDPTAGTIRLDGHDISQLDPRWLRQTMAIVMQEPVLFSGTIYDNIVFGLNEISEERVIEAAKLANAHQFIMEKENQYYSMLGEKGISLSGGEKQRVAIARAILRNPQVLLLDEATSALDNNSEALVQQAINRITQGRTMMVIAHRLSTIVGCDAVIVFDRHRGIAEMRVGKAAVQDYIQSHASEDCELPPAWDEPLQPMLLELKERLQEMRLDDKQLEEATQQLAKQLYQPHVETGSGIDSAQDMGSNSGSGSDSDTGSESS